jgi:hypothetical protein
MLLIYAVYSAFNRQYSTMINNNQPITATAADIGVTLTFWHWNLAFQF